MAQITVSLPTLPKDWKSTWTGILGAVGLILQQYLKTGTFTYETLIIATVISVACYLIGKETSTKAQQELTATVEGIVNNALGSKIPALLTAQQAANGIEQAVADAVVAVTKSDQPTVTVQNGATP